MAKKTDNTLVKNASFLMVAALVSKIIGMLYKSPLSTTLGSQSFALFQFAQNAYFILLMIASFSIPQAVSKVMAEKIAFGRYRDAQRVFYCALAYAAAAGGAVALFCVFGTSILVPENTANARLALQMLAPTIFLSGILGVFRGYFQAYRNMMPTSVSQIIEQIFVAVTALLMSNVMISHFRSQGDEAMERWGAAGATMGTGAGVLAALIFMIFVYHMNKRTIRKKIKRDRRSINESYKSLMKTMILIIMPIILSAFIYNVNGYINSYMYTGIMGMRGEESDLIHTLYAEYGFFMTLINIPLTLASTAPTSMIPEVSAHYAKADIKGANAKTEKATWVSMLISIPAAVGLAVLSGPITRLIFPGTNGVAGELLIIGAITIILNGNSNISNGVLQGIGKPRIPMIHAAVALVADVIAMAILLFFTDLGVYTIVIAMILYAVVMCILNDRAMKRYMKFKNPFRTAYLYPLLASVPMAAVAGGVYYGLYVLIHSNIICLAISIVCAVAVYFAVYLYISKPSLEELSALPGGRTIYTFGRRFHLC
ncbi:MAG TPA: polysaccharide biosynthesis protein [Candidatus Blautia faecavium]|uniref:Polysaccharide biosynthesis protein n=1 Tax=Candidatus Blautia faecavium TaxID=2838487 RepID=A0A9D2RUY7_9FIRM|nr:polysaccharide biosynthesis protein [Candidatus Blautia faecavium]